MSDDIFNLLETFRVSILDENVPATLHHYTDSNGALGMLGREEMWLSHALFSNDKLELKVAQEIVERVVTDLLNSDRLRIDLDNPNLGITYAREFLFKLQYYIQNKSVKVDVYIGCFCENDDLLSQWRAYANNSGYCIGVNAKQLLNETKRIFSDAIVYFTRVSYDEKKWAEGIEQICNFICDTFLESSDLEVDVLSDNADMYSHMVTAEILVTAPFLKHPGFKEEQEWRLAVITNSNMAKPEFRASSVGLLPYLKTITSSAIQSVVIGPGGNQDLMHHAIDLMFPESKIEVKNSFTPLR